MTFALSAAKKFKIGFPGWPEPNLDWVYGFGGQLLEKGACTGPLFSSASVSSKCLVLEAAQSAASFFCGRVRGSVPHQKK
jgi:hypothetical protein